jgi:hypothetical protein
MARYVVSRLVLLLTSYSLISFFGRCGFSANIVLINFVVIVESVLGSSYSLGRLNNTPLSRAYCRSKRRIEKMSTTMFRLSSGVILRTCQCIFFSQLDESTDTSTTLYYVLFCFHSFLSLKVSQPRSILKFGK